MAMTRQETAYRHVRRQLVDGRWREGQMLSPAKVAKEIGVSYTPMREAMIQLATEGILEQAPQGRMYVKTFSRNDMHELFEFRRTLEGGAAELAAEKLTPQQLSDLRTCLQEHRKHLGRLIRQTSNDDTEDILNDLRRVDIQFHLSVIAAGGNPKITKLVNDMHLLTRIFERRIPQAVESSHKLACRIYAYHRRVLRALDARDGEEARKWMARHLRWGQQYHLALLDKQEQKKMASHIEESFLG